MFNISADAGRSSGAVAQHARKTPAMSTGASAGISGRSPLKTTRVKMSKGRASSAHGISIEITSHATMPKLYTSLAEETPCALSTCLRAEVRKQTNKAGVGTPEKASVDLVLIVGGRVDSILSATEQSIVTIQNQHIQCVSGASKRHGGR